MKLSSSMAAWALGSVVACGLMAGMAPLADGRVWNFSSDEPGKPAAGFKTQVGTWEVAADGTNHVLAQKAENPDKTFNLALVEGTSYKDLDLSIRVKAIAGKNDQGGGFVWRAKDKDNYYIARYNPLEDNLRVYKVENGKRTQLDHAEVPGNHDWHTLRITMQGREILGYFDGKKVLVAEDSTFADAGQIGVWSKSDAQSEFDDLTVSGN